MTMMFPALPDIPDCDPMTSAMRRMLDTASPEFLACWSAGVPMDFEFDDGPDVCKVKITTKPRCGVVFTPDGAKVYVAQNHIASGDSGMSVEAPGEAAMVQEVFERATAIAAETPPDELAHRCAEAEIQRDGAVRTVQILATRLSSIRTVANGGNVDVTA